MGSTGQPGRGCSTSTWWIRELGARGDVARRARPSSSACLRSRPPPRRPGRPTISRAARCCCERRAAKPRPATGERLSPLRSRTSSRASAPSPRGQLQRGPARRTCSSAPARARRGWYWLATDHADYSDRYLAWQTGALTSVFEQRAMFTFELPGPAATLRVDGFSVPIGAADRALAFDVGAHTVLATSAEGEAFQGTLDVAPEQVGGRYFFPVAFGKMLRAGEEDPNLPRGKTRPDPPDTSMSALQIGTIIGTVALASGIAVGGGLLALRRGEPARAGHRGGRRRRRHRAARDRRRHLDRPALRRVSATSGRTSCRRSTRPDR
jgi:hypothetical protein